MNVNVWVVMTATATSVIRTRLLWDEEEQGEEQSEYTGPVTDIEHRIFQKMAHYRNVEAKFKRPTIAGEKRHLFSLNFRGTTKAKAALDYIEANRPGHVIVVAAWWWDSRQVGTQWELDQDGERTGNTTGTPTYPIHPRVIDFMPDIVEWDEDGNVISTTPASILSDVNLVQGQQERRFE